MPGGKLDQNGNAVGTSRADSISGNNKSNIVGGLGGNDTLRGLGGADIIDAGAGNDKIYGDGGNDLMSGGLGRDTMTGGAGYDFFAFESRLSKSAIDTVTDFSVKYDTIMLWKGIFKVAASSNGLISSAAFWAGPKAHDRSDRIIYDKSTGNLFFDGDGGTRDDLTLFARLTNKASIAVSDFMVI